MGRLIGLLVLATLWSTGHAAQPLRWRLTQPEPPIWPSSYQVSYVLSLPYTASYQSALKYPVHVWWDASAPSLKMSFYNDLDVTYIVPGATYNVYPRIVTRLCDVINTTAGPTANGASGLEPLPSLRQGGWEYAGTSRLPGKPPAHVWQKMERVGEKVNTYTFHVSQEEQHPVLLNMLGVNLLTGSHFDEYVLDFTGFQRMSSDSAFRPPSMCHDARTRTNIAGCPHHNIAAAQAVSMLPSALVPAAAAAVGHTTRCGKSAGHSSSSVLEAVEGLFAKAWHMVAGGGSNGAEAVHASNAAAATVSTDLQFIKDFNAARAQQRAPNAAASNSGGSPVHPADAHTLAPNKFMGWSDARWRATQLGVKKSKRVPLQSAAHLGEFQRVLRDDQLPDSVDWRGTGADGPVKDQASCGSCWAFATTGAMTGAWYAATKQSISFSEQQIVDCSWNYDVNGCWGGDAEPALKYIHHHGGAVQEADYPYLGQNGYCRENKTAAVAAFKGFKRVPKHDEKALMEALATHGPLSVAFDADHRTFKYYSEGVYYREDCGQTMDDLDHAVTLVGYGTTPSGTDYWILRNSWSQYWGDGGYFKLPRKGNDCGVTLDAVLAVVDLDSPLTKAALQQPLTS